MDAVSYEDKCYILAFVMYFALCMYLLFEAFGINDN